MVLIIFLDKGKLRAISKQNESDRYIKKFFTYNHVVVILFVAFKGFHSIREVVLGLLANANKLSLLGLSYIVRHSTFSEANQRRNGKLILVKITPESRKSDIINMLLNNKL